MFESGVAARLLGVVPSVIFWGLMTGWLIHGMESTSTFANFKSTLTQYANLPSLCITFFRRSP